MSIRRIAVTLFTVICLAVSIGWSAQALQRFYQKAYPVEYAPVVEKYAAENGLDEALVYAIIRTESSFRPLAESSVGARGLMQLTEETVDWVVYRMDDQSAIDYDDLFDVQTNIRCGTFLLRLLISEFGTEQNALCAYHAGWGNAKKWLEDSRYAPDGKNITTIPFGDTRKYVQKVLDTKETYKKLYQTNGQGG